MDRDKMIRYFEESTKYTNDIVDKIKTVSFVDEYTEEWRCAETVADLKDYDLYRMLDDYISLDLFGMSGFDPHFCIMAVLDILKMYSFVGDDVLDYVNKKFNRRGPRSLFETDPYALFTAYQLERLGLIETIDTIGLSPSITDFGRSIWDLFEDVILPYSDEYSDLM